MDRSDTEFDPEEREINSDDGEKDRLKEEAVVNVNPISQLDFYQADPFTHGDRKYHYMTDCYYRDKITREQHAQLRLIGLNICEDS